MIVCVCHRVSDRDIQRAVHDGCDSFEALQDELRVATGCGRCHECARDTFDIARACHGASPVFAPARVVPIALAAGAPVRRLPVTVADLAA